MSELAVGLANAMRTLFAALCLLLSCVMPLSAETSPKWLEVKTEHFTVFTDGGDRQARHTAGQLERMHAVFAKLLPHAADDPGSSIVVLALRDRKSFQSVEPAAYLAKNALDLAGLFLSGDDRNYILLRLDTSGDHPYETVYHEYTHYMTRHADIPVWLNEGLAQFYQNTDIFDKEVRLGQPNGNEILYLRQQRPIPLETLFSVDHNSPFYHEQDKGSVFYGESWALTHFLFLGDYGKKESRLHDYAEYVLRGESSLAAAQHAFGNIKLLQDELTSYINNGDYRSLTMPLQLAIDEKALDVKPVPAFEADAARADVLARDGRTGEAEALATQVLAEAPDSAVAHESMGWIKLREGNLDAARKWYGEAVSLHSSSYLAYYYAGSLGMRDGGDANEDLAEDLRASIKLNPQFAPALVSLAQFDSMHREKLDEALQMALRAVQIDPGNIDYRLYASEVRVQRKELPSAISGLRATAKLAHTPEERARVQARLDQVQQYEQQLSQRDALLAEAATAQQPGTHTALDMPRTSSASGPHPVTDREGKVLHPVVLREPDHKLPDGPPAGPKHTVTGTLHNIGCFYPKGMTLSLGGKGDGLSLYTNDMFAITYTTGNFTPDHDLDPCKEFEGLKAKITYADVTDPSVAGQILSMELNK